MRTTVDIPDPVYRELKMKAAQLGCSVRQLILRGVHAELRGKSEPIGRRVKQPIFGSRRPGSLKLTNETINEILFPDVNVWVALTFRAHVHHGIAAAWLGGVKDAG